MIKYISNTTKYLFFCQMFIQLETSFTEKGFGILVIPWKTLSTLGFLSVSSNVSLCNSLTKNKNNSFLARDSPIQILFPIPNLKKFRRMVVIH